MIQSLTNYAATGYPIVETATTALTRQVYDQDNNLVTELKAEAYNGHAEIDYSPVLRMMYKNTMVTTVIAVNVILDNVDYFLQVKAKIGGTDYTFRRSLYDLSYLYNTKIINSIISETEPTNIPENIIYRGYPKYFSIYSSGSTKLYSYYDASGVTLSQGIHTIEIVRKLSTMHITNNTASNWMKFVEHPTPEHPFYVRWINRYGGWETFMFECNQKHTRQLKANEYYERYQAEGVKTNYHKEGVEVVEVSSGIVSQKVFNELAMLKFSPIIQLYDAMSGTWTDIQVDKGDDEMYTNQPSGEMIISFVLPEIQILK